MKPRWKLLAFFRHHEHLEIIARQGVFTAELAQVAAKDVYLSKSGRLQQPTHFGRRVVALVG